MSRVVIIAPDCTIEFEATNFKKMDVDVVVLTAISIQLNRIHEYVFTDVRRVDMPEVGICFISPFNPTTANLFGLVAKNDLPCNYMRIFEKYKGSIIAYNNDRFFHAPLNDLPKIQFTRDDTFIVTGYKSNQ